MTTLEYTHDVEAPIAALWQTFADFPALMEQMGSDLRTEITGSGIGMQRIFVAVDPQTGAENRFGERLDSIDAQRHELSYTLTEGNPIGMATYAARVRLESLGAANTRIHWHGEFTVQEGLETEQVAEQLQGSYAGMSEGLASYANAHAS